EIAEGIKNPKGVELRHLACSLASSVQRAGSRQTLRIAVRFEGSHEQSCNLITPTLLASEQAKWIRLPTRVNYFFRRCTSFRASNWRTHATSSGRPLPPGHLSRAVSPPPRPHARPRLHRPRAADPNHKSQQPRLRP